MAFSWFFAQQPSEAAPSPVTSSAAKQEEKPEGVLNKTFSGEARAKDLSDSRARFAHGPSRMLSRHQSTSSRRRPQHVGPVQIEFDDEPPAAFSLPIGSRPFHVSYSDTRSAEQRPGNLDGADHRSAREKEGRNSERSMSVDGSIARSAVSVGDTAKTANLFSSLSRPEITAQRFNSPSSQNPSLQGIAPQRFLQHDSTSKETALPTRALLHSSKEEEDDTDLVVGPKTFGFALTGRRRTLSQFPSRLTTLPSLRSFPTASGSVQTRALAPSLKGKRGFREARGGPKEAEKGDSPHSSSVSTGVPGGRPGEGNRVGDDQTSGEILSQHSTFSRASAEPLGDENKPQTHRTAGTSCPACESKEGTPNLPRRLQRSPRNAREDAEPVAQACASSGDGYAHVTASQSRPPHSLQGPLPAPSAESPERPQAFALGRHPLRSSARVSFAAAPSDAAESRENKAHDNEGQKAAQASVPASPRESVTEGDLRKNHNSERHRPGSPSSSASTRVSELDTTLSSSSSSSSLPPAVEDSSGSRRRSDGEASKGPEAEATTAESGSQKTRSSAGSGRPPCEHILLVVHGIGCEAEGGAIHKQQFVKSLALVNEYWFWKKPVEVHVHAINWKQTVIHAQEHMFEHITLKDVYETRRMLTLTAADLLFFLTPRYGDFIMTQVAEQLNEAVSKLRAHPSERYKDSKISVLGYSLGSVMAYELLAGRPFRPSQFNPTTNPSPRLNFHVDSLFLLGSALPAFLLLHAPEILKQGMWLPRDLRLYNIFHPCDPVAFRLEKLVYPQIRQLPPPVLLAFWRTNGVQKWYEWDMNVQHAKNVLMQNITDFASTISNSLFFWWNTEKGNPNPEGISVLDSNATAASAALEEAKKSKAGLLSSSFSSASLVGPLGQKSKPAAARRAPSRGATLCDSDGLRDAGDRRDGAGGKLGSMETPGGRVVGGQAASRAHRRQLDRKGSSNAPASRDEPNKALPLRMKQTLPHVLMRHTRAADSSEDVELPLAENPTLLPRLPPLPSLRSSLSSSLASADSSPSSSQGDLSPSRASSAASSTASSEDAPPALLTDQAPSSEKEGVDSSGASSRDRDARRRGDGASTDGVVSLQAASAAVVAAGAEVEKARSEEAPQGETEDHEQKAGGRQGDSEATAAVRLLAEREAEAAPSKDRSEHRRGVKDGDGDRRRKAEDDAAAKTTARQRGGEAADGDADQNIWDLLYRSNSKEKHEEGEVSDATTSSTGSGAFALEQLEQLEQETSRAMAQLETINEQTGPDILPVRIDFQLQEDTAEHYLSSLAMLQSHFNYWKLKDVAFFILKCLTGTNPTLSYTDHLKQLECAARRAAAKAERESNEAERRRQLKLAAALHRRLDSFNGTSEGAQTSRKGRQPHAKHGSSPCGGTSGKRHSFEASEPAEGLEKSKHRQSASSSAATELSSEGESVAERKGGSSVDSERGISAESGSSKAQCTSRSSHSDGKAKAGSDSADSSSAENTSQTSQEYDKSARKRHLEKRQQRANERLSTRRTVTKSFK
ncbi:conserved hypothetical protein [Neospora caninum Liverpool]|uniref:DDHD domain-containing protein n=1 Tax=Neospora caninum (strain Liverpool) TaxID=572307 RepID=F0VNG8_NEOCL|nr:conserved hypothetical protein [Neospora caninum Liverpool]CBZ55264.1 conserved hypothetical protein [Neospora caninum Liverpool]CEL69994.1 TPA: DDHD domain-containing protein [Neospora caninum Liverpool]|eukprot:XP_003885292.1 conserved hypothetical protein [Neospora caninum Liverpool]